MELFEAIKTRRSVRYFTQKQIPREIVEKIIEAGIHAPSSKNAQPWYFIIDNAERKKKVAEILEQEIELQGHDNFTVKIPGTGQSAKPPTAKDSARILRECNIAIMIFSKGAFTGGRKKVLQYPDMNSLLAYTSEIESIAASVQNMLLAAHGLEIGAVWNCDLYYVADQIQEVYNTKYDFCLALCLGYESEQQMKTNKIRIKNYTFIEDLKEERRQECQEPPVKDPMA